MGQRLRLTALLLAIACAGCGAAAAPDRAEPRDLASVRTWAFAIGDGAGGRNLAGYDLVVVDGQETSASRVRALRRRGAIVLGYLSVGTIEAGRPWSAAARPHRLELWEEWGEWYADVSSPAYRRLVVDHIAPGMLAKGFDGLFVDNVDMIETHPKQVAGMHRLVAALSAKLRPSRRYLFAQNGDSVIRPMLRYLDGWNREDVTSTYDFDAKRYVERSARDVAATQAVLRRIGRAGVRVLSTDYVAAGNTQVATRARANACVAGALPYISDIQLRRVPVVPIRCP